MPYVEPYMVAVDSALKSPNPLESTINLFRHPLYKSAHPTPEHLLPLVLTVAAAGKGDEFEEIFTEGGGMGWGMYRWK